MCLYPKLIKNPKYKPNKKNGGIIPAVLDNRVLAVPIGCGNCIECRKKKTREWQTRLQEEIKHNQNGKFITLTLSNENITKLYNDKKIKHLTGYELDNAAITLATRLWLERWRKKHKKSLKHWLITELGHNGTENIHIHGIVWTNEIEDIKNTWQYGYTYIGKYVNVRTINYIVKYVHKVDLKRKYYKSKILTSAGIGSGYTKREDAKNNKFKGKETKETYVTRSGKKTSLPIYYRNKIYTDQEKEKLWTQKLDEQTRYINGKKIDISNGMELYYKELEEARRQNQRLGYGNNFKEWSREKYENERRTLLQKQREPTNKG